jgi:transcriptional regulator with XRE-family HTH domain
MIENEKEEDEATGFEDWAAELRAQREAAGLTQEQLAARMNFSPSVIAKLETCRTPPSQEHAKRADHALNLPGTLQRCRKILIRDRVYPEWFKGWLAAERRATSLRWWEPLLVPGLFQTEDYARAILGAEPGVTDAEVTELVAARLARQAILDGPSPPMLWVLLDELALQRCIGSSKIMHNQLVSLAEAGRRPKITVQVVPSRAEHAGLLGSFIVASLDDGPDVAYLETSAPSGQAMTVPRVVASVALRFDTLRSVALPAADSHDLIMRVADTKWQS